MSRTYRSNQYDFDYFRHPKTQGERKKLDGFIHDAILEDFSISGVNHAHRRLSKVPTAWDDIRYSAKEEIYL